MTVIAADEFRHVLGHLPTGDDAGDHTIVVARVVAIAAAADGVPLVFFRGRYGRFSSPVAS